MKRHLSLEPFSRDHNVGLILARRLTIAAPQGEGTRREVSASLLQYWRDELEDHFDEEEKTLLPLIRTSELRDRLLSEHRLFRELMDRLTLDSLSADHLAHAGGMLHDHIRWEERVLFPAIERSATDEELAELLDMTSMVEERRAVSTWSPQRGELMRARSAGLVANDR